MNNLGTVAVIRHNGTAVVYDKNKKGYSDELMRRMVESEIKRNNANYEREKEWNAISNSKLNQFRARELKHMRNITPEPLSKRIVNKVCFGIDFVYACIVVWAEELKLIEYIG